MQIRASIIASLLGLIKRCKNDIKKNKVKVKSYEPNGPLLPELIPVSVA